jgi:hypothetical protein
MRQQRAKDNRRAALEVRCGMRAGLERMRANTAWSIRPGSCGLALRCVSGLVVVTQKDDPKDHELLPGDEYRTNRRGLVVAWAVEDSDFTVRTTSGEDEPRRAA